MIDQVLASGTKQGYKYEVNVDKKPGEGWSATAVPVIPGESGYRYFYSDQTGVIRFSHDGLATRHSEEVGSP
jgi:hypothetical protein